MDNLCLTEVSKRYGASVALENLSVVFKPRERTLVLGSNGAGKSTLLRVMSRLSRPDTGSVLGPNAVVSWCGAFLYGALTVRENLILLSLITGNHKNVNPIIEALGLVSVLQKPVGDLSKGFLQRTSLARAFLSSSHYILLDEPTSFLDDEGTGALCNLIAQDKRGVVIATHDALRLRSIATRVLVLADGKIVSDSGAPDFRTDKDGAIQTFISGLR